MGLHHHQLLNLPVDARIAAVAGLQHGQITAAQLRHLGVSATQIRDRLRTGRLHRVHRGVYSVGVLPSVPLGVWTAAVLASGAGAALSHASAGAVWGWTRDGDAVDVTTDRPGAKHRPGIRVHRVSDLDARDLTRHEGIPVTTPARTLLDLAATADDRTVDRRLQDARARRLVDDPILRATLARNPNRPGRPALADAVAGPFTRSELERAFLRLLTAHDLPHPLTNHRWRGFEVDAIWPDHHLAVELDGRQHATRHGHHSDERRNLALTAAGFTVHRFTWFDVTHDPHRVADALATALGSL